MASTSAAAKKAVSDLKARNKAIISAHSKGKTLREIGKETGLSHEGVRKIIARHGSQERTRS